MQNVRRILSFTLKGMIISAAWVILAQAAPNENAKSGDLTQEIMQQMKSPVASEENSAAATGGTSEDAMKKWIYDVCHDQMLQGMKESVAKQQKNLLEDKKVMADMETMAHSVCMCAAPKFTKVVAAEIAKTKDAKPDTASSGQMEAMFEKEATKAIMECMPGGSGAQ